MNKKSSNKNNQKRVKRIARNVIKELGNSFKSLIDKFNKLPEHIKKIIEVWAVVVVIIIIIILASTSNKKYLDDYYELENGIVESTLRYVKKNEIYPVKESKLKLDINELDEFGGLERQELDEKKCVGFTMTYYDEETDEYIIKPYINCDKYTTKDYNEYK